MVTRNSESSPSTSWRYAPGARVGLLIAVLGVAALAIVGQVAAERAVADDSTQALTAGAAGIGVFVVAYGARFVPIGTTYLRQDVGARFAAVVYVVAVVVAMLVRELWLTGVCVGVLVLLAGLVIARRAPGHSGQG